MARAIELAELGQGRTAPNPPVGAVVVRDGRIVGEGHHARAGTAHAEVVALRAAGERARGATLYVTLEPCAHHGRTPPCAEAVIEAGIARVHIGAVDPNPLVAGRGIRRLGEAGVHVEIGQGSPAARALIAPYANLMLRGRPHVTAKYAMTLDGRIAAHTGDSRWVTGPEARRRAHSLRDAADAILVGAGTVLADDPALTTREPDIERDPPSRSPLRIVLDSRGRLPLSARVFDPALPGRTLLATVALPPDHAAALAARGVEVLRLPGDENGRVALPALLDVLGERGIMGLLVEGGSSVLGAFFDQGLVQRVCAFVAPKIVGGARAPGPVGGQGAARMADAVATAWARVERLGDDLLITAEIGEVALPEPAVDAGDARAGVASGSGSGGPDDVAERRREIEMRVAARAELERG